MFRPFESSPSISTKNKPDPFGELVDQMNRFGETHYTRNILDLTFDVRNKITASILSDIARNIRNRYNDTSEWYNIRTISDDEIKNLRSLADAAEYIASSYSTVSVLDAECYDYHLLLEKDAEDDRVMHFCIDTVDGVFYEMLMGNFDNIPMRKEIQEMTEGY